MPSPKIAFFYAPGDYPGRGEWKPQSYTPRQEHIYRAISEIMYAWDTGRLNNLRPTPGLEVDVEDFARWKVRALNAWRVETASRGKEVARPITAEDFPHTAWVWLYQRIKAAPPAHVDAAPAYTYYDG